MALMIFENASFICLQRHDVNYFNLLSIFVSKDLRQCYYVERTMSILSKLVDQFLHHYIDN